MCVRIVKYLNDDFLDMIVPNDVFDKDKVSLYSIENGGWYIMNYGTGYTRKLSKANEILLVDKMIICHLSGKSKYYFIKNTVF